MAENFEEQVQPNTEKTVRKKRLIKLIIIISVVCVLAVALFLSLYFPLAPLRTIEKDGLKFTKSYSSDVYVVTGYTETKTSITIPSEIRGLPVVEIAGGAFANCISLTSVSIPDSIIKINESAFSGCDNLIQTEDDISYVDKWVIKANKYNNYLTNPTLRQNTKGIADAAFADCESLTDITIPKGVLTIGNSAFRRCSSLININIPDSVTKIGESAFADCPLITSINLPQGITEICSGLFWNCSSLTNITIPKSVTKINSYAFQRCRNIMKITIPNSVNYIGSEAFKDCRLQEVQFENVNGWRIEIYPDDIIISGDILTNTSLAAEYLTTIYCEDTWSRG